MSGRLNAWTLSLIVLVIAIGVSGYLSYLKYDSATAVCIEGGQFDCGTVLNSAYSELSGVPIAYLGLGTNLLVVALLLLEKQVPLLQMHGRVIVFMVVLFAFLFSVYLVYVQAAIIGAYCPWCLSHEALITVLFGLTVWRLRGWFNPALVEEA